MFERLGPGLAASGTGIVIGRGMLGIRLGAEIFVRGSLGREFVAERVAVFEGLGALLPAFAGIKIGRGQEASRWGSEIFSGWNLSVINVGMSFF